MNEVITVNKNNIKKIKFDSTKSLNCSVFRPREYNNIFNDLFSQLEQTKNNEKNQLDQTLNDLEFLKNEHDDTCNE